jgi:hypothetical protein
MTLGRFWRAKDSVIACACHHNINKQQETRARSKTREIPSDPQDADFLGLSAGITDDYPFPERVGLAAAYWKLTRETRSVENIFGAVVQPV